MELLNEFWKVLVETSQTYKSFQPASLFNKLKCSPLEEEKILDFFQYLLNHDIIRVGLNFSNSEMPFMRFTKYGSTLIENEGRRNALFELFLELHNSQ